MPLMTIWPVTDFSFATSMICDRFSVIFSVGNLVAVSLVPTWMIISEWADDFVFFKIDKISPVFAPPFELTCKQLLSVDTTSLIVESPMIRRGGLAWAPTWAGWTGLMSLSECIWADNSALLSFKLFISPLNLDFSFDKILTSPHSLLTESVSVVRVCGLRRHEAHSHQFESGGGLMGLARQSSWYQM